MYDICHPAYYHIEKLGCKDPLKISTTFYVYMELCEAKRFWDVTYKYKQDLDLLYLEAKKKKNSEMEIYIPWPTLHNISISKIEAIQKGLNVKGATFVFKSEDTSSILYRVTEGLAKPMAPEVTKVMKEKEENKFELEKEIRRNTSYLYELAKSLNEEDDEDGDLAVVGTSKKEDK